MPHYTKGVAHGITPTEKRTLTFITDYMEINTMPPLLQEIADGLGVSKVTAHQHTRQLARKGFIERTRYVARGIRLIGRCPCCGHMLKKGGA